MTKHPWHFILLIIFVSWLGSCQPAAEETVEPNHYTVGANLQLRLGDMRLGVGNIRVETYTNAAGETVKGATASLTISIRDDPDASQTVRVHPGQQITAGKYFLEIVEVSSDKAEVELIVTQTTSAP